MCGGTPGRISPSRLGAGLSPRVRGNRGYRIGTASRAGSIPACAGEPWSASGPTCVCRVYPRVCGGTSSPSSTQPVMTGLSPRVRGNLSIPMGNGNGGGSIPACAGEPSAVSRGIMALRVYPRVCGGTRQSMLPSTAAGGLSPRVRGNHQLRFSGAGNEGSIPACAGEPDCGLCGHRSQSVYPRVCGGTREPRGVAMFDIGLSPRVRGNLLLVRGGGVGRGSIPACAGEPHRYGPHLLHQRVYPRVCGGTSLAASEQLPYPGLSPRVRGNRIAGPHAAAEQRSIPACAGEPASAAIPAPQPAVYPRVCGGTDAGAGGNDGGEGLSPRVRGNQEGKRQSAGQPGSIPACAGEPCVTAHEISCPTVYPRVCGGTCHWTSIRSPAGGLSPRVRGNPGWAASASGVAGSIPACAGEPWPAGIPRRFWTVYPRVCGGTLVAVVTAARAAGLSPRVRGNRCSSALLTPAAGSIPACAGEPASRAVKPTPPRVYPRVCGGTDLGLYGGAASEGLSPRVRGNPVQNPHRRTGAGSIPACVGEPPPPAAHRPADRVYPRVCGGTWQGGLAA